MDDSLQNALVSWVNTFIPDNVITSLTDTQIFPGRLLGLITEKIFGAGADACPHDEEECLEYVSTGLAEYYQIPGNQLVSVQDIFQRSELAIGKVLMLLLSWAVHSQQVEQFIADIRSLSSEDQHSLMLLINSTMKQFGDGALVAGTFHVGLVCSSDTAATADIPDGAALSTPSNTDSEAAEMSPTIDDSLVRPPGGTPARGLPHIDDTLQSPVSHCKSTLARSRLDSRINPTPTSSRKFVSRSSQPSVHFTPPSSRVPSTPKVSSSKQSGAWRNASPALKRWMTSPACSKSTSTTSAESNDGIHQRMSSVTYALREQISLREDLEMQLSQTQEDLTKSERNVREYERQCKVLEAQVAEMEDLQHTEVELKKTQAKLERAMKRLESANDVKNHAEHLQEQLTIARADVISLETKMAQSDDVAGRVEFYKAQLHSSELRCSSEHAHVEQLQSEVEKLSTRYGESTASVATVTAEMTRLQGQVEVLQEELDKVTGANASAESCDQLTLADQAEISRLQRENEDLRAMLPSREEMRLMRSQVEDATAMKKSFESLYVEHKRQLLEMAEEKSGLERQLTDAKEKEQKTQHLLDTECGTSSSLQQQLQLSEESLATAAEENTRLSNAMDDGISEMRALKSQVFELQQQLSVSRHELEASNDAAATQKEHLLEQVGELRLELDTVNHVLQETGKKYTALVGNNEAHQEQRKHWQHLLHTAHDKTSDLARQLELANNDLTVERERHHSAFVKLQAKYDEVCLERQSSQQQIAIVKTQLASLDQEKQDVQDSLTCQQSTTSELETKCAQLEQSLGESLERAQKQQSSLTEQAAQLQKKLEDHDETGREILSSIGQEIATLLQRMTGSEWSALDVDASSTAQHQNITSLLTHTGEQHNELLEKKTNLQAEVDGLRSRVTALSKQANDDVSSREQRIAMLTAELEQVQASLVEKTQSITDLANSDLIAERERHRTAFTKLQAKYDEVCLECQSSQQQIAIVKAQLTSLDVEKQDVQSTLTRQRSAAAELEARNSQLEQNLGESLERAQKQQSSLTEQAAQLQKKLEDHDETGREILSSIGQEIATLLQRMTGSEWSALDVDASSTAQHQNITSLLTHTGEQHNELLEKKTNLQAEVDDLRSQVTALSKQANDNVSSREQRISMLTAELEQVQASLVEKTQSITDLANSDLVAERERHQTAFTKLQAKYDEVCLERQSSQQQIAMVKTQLASLDQERQDVQSTLTRQRSVAAELEAKNTQLEQNLGESLERAQKQQSSLAEQAAQLQKKLEDHDESGREILSSIGQEIASLLQRMTGSEWSALDVDASSTAQHQNITSLLTHTGEQHNELLEKKTNLQAEVDDLRSQLTALSKQANDNVSSREQRISMLTAELEQVQASLVEKTQSITDLANSDLVAERERHQTAFTKLQAKYDEVCLERQSSQQQIAMVKTQLASLDQERQDVQSTLTRQRSVAAELEAKNTQLEQNLGESLERAQKQQSSLAEQAAQLQKKLEDHDESGREILSSIGQEIATLLQRMTGSEWSALDVDASSTAQHQNITSLLTHTGEQHNELLEKKTNLQAEVDDLRSQVTALSKQANDNVSSREQRISMLTAELEQVQASLVEKTQSITDLANSDLVAERERHQTAFTKLQAKYDEVCLECQSSQQQIAIVKAQLASLDQEKQDVQSTLTRQRSAAAELETKCAQVEQNLGESLERAQKQQSSLTEQAAQLQKKLEDHDETGREILSSIGREIATLLQRMTGSEWSALDVDASSTAQHQNITSLLTHTGEQHNELLEKKTNLQADVDDLRCQVSALSKVSDDTSSKEHRVLTLSTQLDQLQTALLEKADRITYLESKRGDLQRNLDEAMQAKASMRHQYVQSQAAETESKLFAEQASTNYHSLQNEMDTLIQQYQAESDSSKATCRAVMEEAKKRGEEATAEKQELKDELECMQERVEHYKHMTSTMETQLKLATQQLQSQQQQRASLGHNNSGSGSGSYGRMAQPGYESVHKEFDTGRHSVSQIETLQSPVDKLNDDISSFLTGTDRQQRRTSIQPTTNTTSRAEKEMENSRNSGGRAERSGRWSTATASSRPPFAWGDNISGSAKEESDDDLSEGRLKELQRRNTIAAAHLKSTYPVELQVDDRKASIGKRKRPSSTTSSTSSNTSSQRASSHLSAMPSVAEEQPSSISKPAPVESFAMEFSPPSSRRSSSMRQLPAKIAAMKRSAASARHEDEDDDSGDSAKRRQTFLIASPKPKEKAAGSSSFKSRVTGRAVTSALADNASGRSSRGSSRTADVSTSSKDVVTSSSGSSSARKAKLPAHLQARMASYQQKASEKAAAAAAIKSSTASSKKSRPLTHRNKV